MSCYISTPKIVGISDSLSKLFTDATFRAIKDKSHIDTIIADINDYKSEFFEFVGRKLGKNIATPADIFTRGDVNSKKWTDLNEFKKWIKEYELIKYPSVSNTTTRTFIDNNQGFYSQDAAKFAQGYTATKIIDKYIETIAKKGSTPSFKGGVVNRAWLEAKQSIISTFINNILPLIDGNHINLNNLDETSKQAILSLKDNIVGLNSRYNGYLQNIDKYFVELDKTKEELEDLIKETQQKLDRANKNGTQQDKDNIKENAKKKKDAIAEKRKQITDSINSINDNLHIPSSNLSRKAIRAAILLNQYTEYFNTVANPIRFIYGILSFNTENHKLKNYAALCCNLLENSEYWMNKVINGQQSMIDLKNAFENLDENSKIFVSDNQDEDDIRLLIDELTSDIDASTANWEDHFLRNYLKHFDGRIIAYLNSIPILNSTEKDSNGHYSFYNDNELGVEEYYGAGRIINTIYHLIPNIFSPDEFITNIENVAKNIPELSGFIKIAEDMRADRDFANKMSANFSKPVMPKYMINIGNELPRMDISNTRAFNSMSLYYTLYSSARNLYRTVYDVEDNIRINNIKNILKLYSNKKDKFISEKLNKDTNDTAFIRVQRFISRYINNYFPDIETSIVSSYLASPGNEYNHAVELVGLIDKFNTEISNINDRTNKEDIRFSKAWAKYKKEHPDDDSQWNIGGMIGGDIIKSELSDKKNDRNSAENEELIYNDDYVNFNSIVPTISKFANIFNNTAQTNTELNSRTATNDQSSDILKNSYISNFIKQLEYMADNTNSDGTLNQKGLEYYKNFVTKVATGHKISYNAYSTILFGVKDANGNIIKEGIFNKNADGSITISKDIIHKIKIGPFMGVRNEELHDGSPYDELSRGDYFASTIIAFNTAKDLDHINTSVNELANFLFRIPSDASNNYQIQLPKYKTTNRYYYDFGRNASAVYATLDSLYNQNYDLSEVNKYSKEIKSFAKDLAGTGKTSLKYYTSHNDKLNYINNINDLLIFLNDIREKQENGILNTPYNINLSDYNFYTVKSVANEQNEVLIPIIFGTNENNGKVVWALATRENNKTNEAYIKQVIGISDFNGANTNFDGIFNNENDSDRLNISLLTNAATMLLNLGYNKGIKRIYDRDNPIVAGFINQIKNSVSKFVDALQVMTEVDSQGRILIKTDTEGLFDFYHLADDKGHIFTGKEGNLQLGGKVFKLYKLFDIDSYSAEKTFEDFIHLYSSNNSANSISSEPLFVETKNDKGELTLMINPNRIDAAGNTEFFNISREGENLVFSTEIGNTGNILDNEDADYGFYRIASEWLNQYESYIYSHSREYDNIISTLGITEENVYDAILNQTIVFMEFDDLFEGSYAFYKDPQTFFKRAKEIQMSGTAYMGGVDFNIPLGETSTIKDALGNDVTINLKSTDSRFEDLILPMYNYWNAITVKNTATPYARANEIYNEISEDLKNKGVDEKDIDRIASGIAKGYGYISEEDKKNGKKPVTTKVNDAQSFIIFDEFIRRKFADGTRDEYGDLLFKLKKLNDITLKMARHEKLTSEEQSYYDRGLTPEDYDNIAKKIQIQKNVYYDIAFDNDTNVMYSRQIKNAEFVLIPFLLPKDSSWFTLAEIMDSNNLGQVNTVETSKAANHNVLTFWDTTGKTDEKGRILFDDSKIGEGGFRDKVANSKNVETFFYRYLYRQEDILDSHVDEENKAGIQITKKIFDNILLGNGNFASETLKTAAERIQNNFSENIYESFTNFIDECGWKIVNGLVVNKEDENKPLKYEFFYKRAQTEAQRINMDENFLEFITPDADGYVIMPNWLNNVSSKLESIAQAVFNRNITRQTLPGFHDVQLTNVGADINLQYYPKEGENEVPVVECAINVWSSELESVVKRLMNTGLSEEQALEEVLKRLHEQKMDEFIGYRIPTEGKQSVAIFRIKKLLYKVQGSTMMVANDWVTQTGSDFDRDSIYTITWEHKLDNKGNIIRYDNSSATDKILYNEYLNSWINKIKNNIDSFTNSEQDILRTALNDFNAVRRAKKENKEPLTVEDYNKFIKDIKESGLTAYTFEEFSKLPREKQLSRKRRNNEILQGMMDIIKDKNSREEIFTRSQYDDLTASKNKYESMVNSGSASYSVYNPFNQLQFMQNAMDGRKLKAFSVNRDTLNSINNMLRTMLNTDNAITVKYDLSKYSYTTLRDAYGDDVKIYDEKNNQLIEENDILSNGKYAKVVHRRIGHSLNNRNVVGKLLTAYSSQTTAHILDAIKQGAIYNETDYTFKVLKTLVDVGIDYDTALAFLMQPAITMINEDYNNTNSIFIKEKNNPIKNTYRKLFAENNIYINNKPVNSYTGVLDLYEYMYTNKSFIKKFKSIWGINPITKTKSGLLVTNAKELVLGKNILEERLKNKYPKDKQFIIDLGITMLFDYYNNTSNRIENIMGCVKPDSFGAKQTVHDTRKILKNIAKYSGIDDATGRTLLVNGEPMLKAIYPGFKFNRDTNSYDFDETKSKYKFLAYYLKYSTIPSVTINSQLFTTENSIYQNFVEAFESKLGRELNSQEYEELKKFAISRVYWSADTLVMPVVINENGFITVDEKSEFSMNDEINRIYGYEEKQADSFMFKDINNPTDEEMEAYRLLTPLQKVNFIKRIFVDDFSANKKGAGLFRYIETNKYYPAQLKNSGYSPNRLRVNTYKQDISKYYRLFSEAFSNTNPIIKYAAIDLIKYAYIVDGGRYKNGSLAKIIPNEIIQAQQNQFGLGLLDKFIDSYDKSLTTNIMMNPLEGANEIMDNFVRSHSNLTQIISFDKETSDLIRNDYTIKLGDVYDGLNEITAQESTKLIIVENTGKGAEIIKRLLEKNETFDKYVRLKTRRSKYKYDINLYKICPIVKNDTTGTEEQKISEVVLMPMPLLDSNEVYDVSRHKGYNKRFYSQEFYQIVAKDSLDELSLDLNTYKLPEYRRTNIVSHNDENTLQNIANDYGGEDIVKQRLAQNIIDQIENWYNVDRKRTFADGRKNAETSGYITINSRKYQTAQLFGVKNLDGFTIQTINLSTGEQIRVKIQKVAYNTFNKISKVPRLDSDTAIKKAGITPYQVEFASKLMRNEDSYDPSTNEFIRNNIFSVSIAPESNDTTELKSKFSNIGDSIRRELNEVEDYSFETEIANYIAHDIYREAKNNEMYALEARKELFSRGVSIDSLKNINEGKFNIYAVASSYYNVIGNKLINQMFKTDIKGSGFYAGENYYSIDDNELYEELKLHPERATDLYTLLIRALSFGDSIKKINLITDFKGEDSITEEAIKSIQAIINKVSGNVRIKKAVERLYNKFIAEEYSNNPLIKIGVTDLLDSYGDTDWFDYNFASILHVNNKLVQVIVTLANNRLAKAQLDAPEKVAIFEKKWAEFEKAIGEENMQAYFDKIIGKDGIFIKPYTQQWIEDRDSWIDKLKDAEIRYGKQTLEYQKVKLEKDKWFADNIEQEGPREYYVKMNNITEKVLNEAPDYYIEYIKLNDLIYNKLNDLKDLSPEDKKKREDAISRIAYLRSSNTGEIDKFGYPVLKPKEELKKANALSAYINDSAEINSEYKEKDADELFLENLNMMEAVINNYVKKHPNSDYASLRDEFPEFKEAYDWIRLNAVRTYKKEVMNEVLKNFELLKTSKIINGVKQLPNKNTVTINRIVAQARELYSDFTGDIDGRKIDKNMLDELKKAQLAIYYQDQVPSDYSDAALIKDIPFTDEFTQEFYDTWIKKEELTDDERNYKLSLYTQINNILEKALTHKVVQSRVRDIIDPVLLSELSEDKLRELADLYRQLEVFNKNKYKEDAITISDEESSSKKPYKIKIHTSATNAYRKLNLIKDKTKKDLVRSILFVKNDRAKSGWSGRTAIYGYIVINKEFRDKYIDKNKTEARKFIDASVEFDPNKYYRLAEVKAEQEGRYDEWFNDNHVYNPYSRQYEPLRIWTHMRLNPASVYLQKLVDKPDDDLKEFFSPRYFNTTSKFLATNPAWNKGKYTYRNTAKYKNPEFKKLSDNEYKFMEYLTSIANDYAKTYQQKEFTKNGYLPRLYQPNIDKKWAIAQAANIVGLGNRNEWDKPFHEDLNYLDDIDISFSMFELLKAKGYKKHNPLPERADFATNEQYADALKQVKKLNKEIDENNLTIDNSVLNRDWKQVYKTLILRGEEFAAKYEMKDLLYLTLDTLRNQQVLKTTGYSIDGSLVRDRINSVIDKVINKTTDNHRTADIFENWMRRYLYSEFKAPSKLGKYADKLQAFTTAKYMMLNIRGGIANINTGMVNIIEEALAGDYFTGSDLRAGMAEYRKNIIPMLSDFFTEKSSSEVGAIIKWFNIVDVDLMLGAPSSEKGMTSTKFVEDVNTILYSAMGMGEHFMQNSTLLAMLHSHRIYKDPETEKVVIGTFQNYINGIENAAFRTILERDERFKPLVTSFNNYLNDIKNNKSKAKAYEELHRQIIGDFVRSDYVPVEYRKELAEEYRKEVKSLEKTAKEEFNNFDTVRSRLVFNREEGREVINNPEGKLQLTSNHLADLKNEAFNVNQKIHGVYDKIGAANIEKYWWGGLVMQYHKHIYPGYLKRWARKGYFSETRKTFERGSRWSFFDWVDTPFRKGEQSIRRNYDPETQTVRSLAGIAMRFVDCIMDLKFNYYLLPIWEQNNIKRNLGDFAGIASGLLFTLALYGLVDDDDVDDDSVGGRLYSTMLYLADRLYSESNMYTLRGAYTEFSTQWSQPIAGGALIKDIFKAADLITKSLTDPEFDWTYKNTQYKGQNKMSVLIKRNIPILRVYQRFMNAARNNKYYRINENNVLQSAFKNLGISFNDFLKANFGEFKDSNDLYDVFSYNPSGYNRYN